MTNTILESALRYAELGYPVFPCAPGAKTPLTPNGFKGATTDAATIEAWWNAHPTANVAIATAGLLVVDVDTLPDGSPNTWLADQPDKMLDLAIAPLSLTPRRGRHFCFRQPAGLAFKCTAGKLAPNVDTRADGGYILAPPSAVDGKPYRWLSESHLGDMPREGLPEPPQWLLDLLDAAAAPKRAPTPKEDLKPLDSTKPGDDFCARATWHEILAPHGWLFGGERHGVQHWTRPGKDEGVSATAGHCKSESGRDLFYVFTPNAPPLEAGKSYSKFAAYATLEHGGDFGAAASALAGKGYGREASNVVDGTSPTTERPANDSGNARSPIYRPILTRLSDVQPEQVRWLWPGRIALGKLTLLAGDPGLGKSFLSLDLAARVSLGVAWPDNRLICAPLGGVVLLNAEDALGDTVRPRLDAMAADVNRIIALEAILQGVDRLPVNLQRDLAAVEQAIEQAADCRLVVIDPISAYLGKVDSHNNADIRAMLHPLADLADRHKVAVVAVTHLNKGQGSALYRATGSLAFVAAARAAWLVAKDPDSPRRRLFLPVKNNLAGDTLGMAFQIGDGVLQWEPDPVTIDADRLLAPAEPGNRRGEDASDWLRGALANGPVAAKDLFDAARAEGISTKSLRFAKEKIQAESRKGGFGHGWEWWLPCEDALEDAQGALPQNRGIFGHLREIPISDQNAPSWDDCIEPDALIGSTG